jgi:protein-disulfide isomerase
MTFGSQSDDRSIRNSRREEAREKARLIREQQRKHDKRTRLLIRTTVALFSVALIGIVAIFMLASIRPAGPGPLNMRSDGILIGENFEVTPTGSVKPGQSPVPSVREEGSEVIAIQMYVDYFCPVCGAFETANGDQIATWVETGAATLEVHPLAILDRVSQGSKYSTRSANAAACVANYSPDEFYAFHTLLFANLPEENTTGLDDSKLAELTVKANVRNANSIEECIEEQSFRTWVTNVKDRAMTGPIPNTNVEAVTTTPTIIVNGLKYTGAPNDPAAFAAFVVQAAGENFNESSTPTPTPTPSA